MQVAELYKNCIKLASENKISAKNTWSLPLIDHMSDLVKPSAAERDQTNFQRASCTLETVGQRTRPPFVALPLMASTGAIASTNEAGPTASGVLTGGE